MSDASVVSIHAGKIAPLGAEGVPSAFIKASINRAVNITPRGIEGDEQADLSVHGGLEKAVYGYAREHYEEWRAEQPQHAAALVPGGFGENLCIAGLREADLYVGDVHRIGSARLQICQPRQPCFKLALRFGDKKMPKAMIRSGRAGWYYRVIEAGIITPGDSIHVEARPNPDFPFTRLVELISYGRTTRSELQHLREMQGLASDWKAWAEEQLSRPA